jgi:RimJ/RimL family protein N-acetyltransferase
LIELAPTELLTERLRLRAPRRGDSSPLHEAIEETLDQLVPWLPWARPGHSRAETRRYLRAARAAWARRTSFEFVIETAGSGMVLGITSLHRIDWLRRSAGIGYWIRRSRFGQGFATEACETVLAHAFDALRINRVEALIALANKPSQRVVEKLGFTREGVSREAELIDGEFLDHYQYSLLDGDRQRVERGGAL